MSVIRGLRSAKDSRAVRFLRWARSGSLKVSGPSESWKLAQLLQVFQHRQTRPGDPWVVGYECLQLVQSPEVGEPGVRHLGAAIREIQCLPAGCSWPTEPITASESFGPELYGLHVPEVVRPETIDEPFRPPRLAVWDDLIGIRPARNVLHVPVVADGPTAVLDRRDGSRAASSHRGRSCPAPPPQPGSAPSARTLIRR